ncbi:hypothetical protein B0H10DRAFT_646457 [Mycena sp. CBHHK59/15]|nr:hypothetical protein B0H10DRAFT_646457 [Mycena sp. CBHHK59/15]
MLRRRRSLAALVRRDPDPELPPPLPLPLPGSASSTSTTPTPTPKSRSLIRRVSSLFKLTKLTNTKPPKSGSHGLAVSHIAVASSSTTTLRESSEDEEEDEEDDIRRPSDLGRPASLRSLQLLASPIAGGVRPWDVDSDSAKGNGNADTSVPRVRALSSPALLLMWPSFLPPQTSRKEVALPLEIWVRVLVHTTPTDAAMLARVNRALCSAARSRLYQALDLRHVAAKLQLALHLAPLVEELTCVGWPPWDGDVRELPALRTLIIFPPSSSFSPPMPCPLDVQTLVAFLRVHPALERLAVLGEDTPSPSFMRDTRSGSAQSYSAPASPYSFHSADNSGTAVKTDTHGAEIDSESTFLPNLTQLHAPPLLAVEILERLPTSPSSSSISAPSTIDVAPISKPLSPAALAFLSVDPPHALTLQPSALKRSASHKSSSSSSLPHAEGQHVHALSPAALALLSPDAPSTSKRILSANPPALPTLSAKRERSASIKRSRSASVSASHTSKKGVETTKEFQKQHPNSAEVQRHPHPLHTLRISIARPLYEGGVGGGRVGAALMRVMATHTSPTSDAMATTMSAKEGVNARGGKTVKGTIAFPERKESKQQRDGLHLHLLFGPRVDRRTVEKVLASVGGALASSASLVSKAGGSGLKGRGREGRERSGNSGKEGCEGQGLALLEVRSAVRTGEVCVLITLLRLSVFAQLLVHLIPTHTLLLPVSPRVLTLIAFLPLALQDPYYCASALPFVAYAPPHFFHLSLFPLHPLSATLSLFLRRPTVPFLGRTTSTGSVLGPPCATVSVHTAALHRWLCVLRA